MHTIQLSDKDVAIIDTALLLLEQAVAQVRDEWLASDVNELRELHAWFTLTRAQDRERRRIASAKDQNRRQ